MAHERLGSPARRKWLLVATLGLVMAGFLLALFHLLGLATAIILGVILVFLFEPGAGRGPQARDAQLLARQAKWEAGWAAR
jgi:hypothetical protein